MTDAERAALLQQLLTVAYAPHPSTRAKWMECIWFIGTVEDEPTQFWLADQLQIVLQEHRVVH